MASHVLSEKSSSLNRDVFVFFPGHYVILLAGVSTRRHPHLTISTFFRWLSLVDHEFADYSFALRRVELKPWSSIPFRWSVDGQPGTALDLHSGDLLPPGDYASYTEDGKPFFAVFGTYHRSVHVLSELKKWPSTKAHLDSISRNLSEHVFERDKQCIFTGEGLETDLSWIFPPSQMNLYSSQQSTTLIFDADGELQTPDPESYRTAANLIVLKKSLEGLFNDNVFGVDVDDNYRIEKFRDIPHDILPTHLPSTTIQHLGGASDMFFRDHFRHCVRVHIVGGDISDDYSPNNIRNAEIALGLVYEEDTPAPVTDPKWQTPLGKAIWECYMNDKLS